MALKPRSVAQRKPAASPPSGAREVELPTGGAPLPEQLRAEMERCFATDFSAVRVHEGDAAPHLGAVALATGDDLHFAPGAYDPASSRGRALIGHELAHVVQQREGRVAPSTHGPGPAVNADEALEREADAWGEAAARGEVVHAGAPAGGARGAGPIQRKTAVGLIKDVATSSLTREMLTALIAQHKLEHLAETIENAVLWWFDPKLSAGLAKVKELLVGEGLRASLAYLGSYVTPVLGWLNTLRGVVKILPEAVRTVLAYGIGRGFTGMLGYLVNEARAEAITSTLLIDVDLAAAIAAVGRTLDDMVHRPASTIYRLVWSWIGRPALDTDAPTPARYAVEALTGGATGTRAEPADATAPPREPAEVTAPLVKKDLKYAWLEIDRPALARFQHHDHASGGLVLPFSLGVRLFGTELGTRTPAVIQLPWSGGFTLALHDLAITHPPSLPPVFTVGGIALPEVVLTERGLEHFAARVTDLGFADGAVTLPTITATYDRGRGLVFTGAAAATILGTRIDGDARLELDGEGGFAAAELGLVAPDTLAVIPDVLALRRPAIRGRVARDGQIDIGVSSDVRTSVGIVDLELTHAYLAYRHGRGHEFAGGVDELVVRIGRHVTLRARDVRLDREGLTVAEAALCYQHDPAAPDGARAALRTIGGLDVSRFTCPGLSSLTIGGRVVGLRIGPGARMSADGAEVSAGPPRDGATGEADDRAARPGLSVESIHPVLSRLGGSLFGVSAEFDLERRRGAIRGEATYQPSLPHFRLAFPFLPGVEAQASFGADLKLGAHVDASAAMTEDHRFRLSGTVGASATLAVEVQGGVQLGSQALVAIGASLYARAQAMVAATAGVRGVLVLDGGRLRVSDKPDERPTITYQATAELSADVGATAHVAALLFVNKELWRYQFKKWSRGSYHAAGAITSGDDGAATAAAPSLQPGKPEAPIECTRVDDAQAELRKPQAIAGSAPARRAYLAALVEKYRLAEPEVARDLERAFRAGRKEEEARLRQVYREIQLVLVDAAHAADDVLERGEVDVESIEARIRAAAEAADAGPA